MIGKLKSDLEVLLLSSVSQRSVDFNTRRDHYPLFTYHWNQCPLSTILTDCSHVLRYPDWLRIIWSKFWKISSSCSKKSIRASLMLGQNMNNLWNLGLLGKKFHFIPKLVSVQQHKLQYIQRTWYRLWHWQYTDDTVGRCWWKKIEFS